MDRRLASACLIACASLACDGALSGDGEPFPGAFTAAAGPGERLVHLWYADGDAPPTADSPCGDRRPPPFSCAFAPSRAACQAAVQAHLQRWYARFPVHFTVVAPPPSVLHDTVIISGEGAWCGNVPLGLAPVTCDPLAAGTVWAFECGDSAEDCAAIIAQEHGHLIGLEHTSSSRDVMANPLCRDCDGFEDHENPVVAGRCRRTQNSFVMMQERLGETMR